MCVTMFTSLVIIVIVTQGAVCDPISDLVTSSEPFEESFPGCGLVTPSNVLSRTIAGGEKVMEDEPLPWMVYVCALKENFECEACGGSLISKHHNIPN